MSFSWAKFATFLGCCVGLLGLASLSHSDEATPFDFAHLMGLIQTKNIQSIDELIPQLPENYRRYFAVMLKSGSLQNATPESPRLILYGAYDALYPGMGTENLDRLYLGVQTDTSKEHSEFANSLEVIEWRPASKDYQFYQVDFPITAKSVTVNPARCFECHGTPLRPNWTAYPRWDGALGNNNGITGRFEGGNFGTSDDEAHAFLAHLQTTNPRVKSLDFEPFIRQGLEYPNSYLSDKVNSQLKIRDANLFRKLPEYSAMKYALAGAFMECGNFSEFFDAATVSKMQVGVFANLNSVPGTDADVKSAEDLSFENLRKMTAPLLQRNGVHFGVMYGDEVYMTTWLRFLFEGRGQAEVLHNILGTPSNVPIDSTGWSYDFVGFANRMTELRTKFFEEAAKDLPEMLMYSPNSRFENGSSLGADSMSDETCGTLAKLSRSAIAKYNRGKTPFVATRPSSDSRTVLFQKYCTSCHLSGAHPLPLADMAALRAYRVNDGRTIADRLRSREMPRMPAPQPSDDERAQMIQALESTN